MAKYRVEIVETIQYYVDVDAPTKAIAEERAIADFRPYNVERVSVDYVNAQWKEMINSNEYFYAL